MVSRSRAININASRLLDSANAWSNCLARLESTTFEWLTTLKLVNVEDMLDHTHLNSIGKLRNLVGLHLLSSSSRSTILDDRLIKAWGHQAANDHAFLNLRTLFFTGRFTITEVCFSHLDKFPSLSLFGLQPWYRNTVESKYPSNYSPTWSTVNM